MGREEFQVMEIECTGLWADLKANFFSNIWRVSGSLPFILMTQWDLMICVKLGNIIFCIHMIQLMPYSSWNFNLQ